MFKELNLGPRQRTTVAAAMTLGAVLVLLLVFAAILWVLIAFVGTFRTVLLPPVVAGILTMLLRPYYDLLLKLCRGSQAAALILFFLSALVPLAAFIWFAGAFAFNQLLQLFDDLSSMISALQEAGRSHMQQGVALLKKYGLMNELGSLVQDHGEMVAGWLKALGKRMSQSVFQMFQSAAGLFAWVGTPCLSCLLSHGKTLPGQSDRRIPAFPEKGYQGRCYISF